MATISAALVKELRDKTQAGMMACKKALQESAGDIEKAIELMRKSGEIKAQQKSNRTAAEGVVKISLNADLSMAVMLEINSETDFVAKDTSFNEFVQAVATAAVDAKISSLEDLAAIELDSGQTVEAARLALVAKIGENIQIRRIERVQASESGVLGHYTHNNKIGVLVSLDTSDVSLAKDIAMHIAASKPMVVNQTEVPADVIAKERDIYAAQAKESGKPDDIVEKMVQGRIDKYLNDISLQGQPFVKNPDQKVSQVLKAASANVLGFIRFEVGEGIEKKVDNFAEEVMSQVKGD